MAINKKLIFWNNKSNFSPPTSSTDTTQSVLWHSIVFFNDTKEIWTHGVYFSGMANTLSSTLTGYSVGANSALAGTDTVLSAFGKVQGQLNNKLNLSGGTLTGALTISGAIDRKLVLNSTDSESFSSIDFQEAGTVYTRLIGTTTGLKTGLNGEYTIYHSGNSNNSSTNWSANALTLATALSVANGGLGKTSITSGAMLYASSSNTYAELTTSSFGRGLLNTTSGTKITGLNAEYLNGYLQTDISPYVLYTSHPTTGVLITTTIAESTDSMITLLVEGNGYSEQKPFYINAQCYNYITATPSIISYKAVSLNYDTTIYAFVYGGYICFWFAQTGMYETFFIRVHTHNSTGTKNCISSATNVNKPASGITREVSMTPDKIYHSANIPTWNQSTTGNAATATTWQNARTLTIGSTGKSVNGSANVSWSLSEIGALPLAGGTLTNRLIIDNSSPGDGGWDKAGILIRNNNATAGEVALAYQNISTGSNYWIVGLNQSNIYKIAFASSFDDSYVKFALDTSGNVTMYGGLSGVTTFTANSTVTLSGLLSSSETTALMINSSNVVSKRVLGSNAFNSTSFLSSQYTTHLYVGATGAASHGVTTNGNTYIKLYDDSTARESVKISGTGATTVTSDANGNIVINSTDTNTTYSAFVGGSSGANGVIGLVPAPTTVNYTYFLKGTGSWAQITYSDLTGTVPTWNQNTTGNAASATYASAVTLTADNTTNATRYMLFVDAATGNLSPRTDTGFTYNPSTGFLTAAGFAGNLAWSYISSKPTTLSGYGITDAQISNKVNTDANWSSTNPVLASGEIGIVSDASPVKIKIGDGTTAWNSLADFKISKAAIESVLTGEISTHTHAGGGTSSSTITSMANMPIDKNILYINISSAQSTITYTSTPSANFQQTWFIKNSSGSNITQAFPNSGVWISHSGPNLYTFGESTTINLSSSSGLNSVISRNECVEAVVKKIGNILSVNILGKINLTKTGDILCSDNSIVTASDYASSGKTGIGVIVKVGTIMFSVGKNEFFGAFTDSYVDLNQTNYTDASSARSDMQSSVNASWAYSGHTYNMSLYGSSDSYVGYYAYNTYPSTAGNTFYWGIPTMGEWFHIISNLSTINSSLSTISGTTINTNRYYWTSTEYDQYYAWRANTSNYFSSTCNTSSDIKTTGNYARAITYR